MMVKIAFMMNIYPYVNGYINGFLKKSRIYSEVLSLIAMIILVCLNYMQFSLTR